jgi:hypothetical protein
LQIIFDAVDAVQPNKGLQQIVISESRAAAIPERQATG